jgi:hypothetical protein
MSDLLKEAIADAKAVRETALANAKMALEEAFTPHLKSMLSAKLAEDEFEDEEDGDDEFGDEEEDAEEMARTHYREDDDEIDMGEPEPEMGEEEPEEDEFEEEGVSEEDIIEIDGVKYAPIVTEDEFEEDVNVDETEELDLEAVIRELEQEIAESEDLDEDELDEYSGTKAQKRAKDGNVVRHNENDEVDEETELVEDDEVDEDKEKQDEQSTSSGIGKGTGVKQASASDEEDPGKGKVHEHVENLQTELNEYKEAVTYLRDKLHEVNILNAKLLYTNKLFREYALSNDQKLKIVETFDRAQTAREIKLVYSTLAESFGDNGVVTKKSSVKESASRKTGTTAPQKKIISEENQVANRFQKLAGILKD